MYNDTILFVQVPRTQNFAIRWIHLGGKAVDRILQILDVGHVANQAKPDGEEASYHTQNTSEQECPQYMYETFSHFDFNLISLMFH